MAKNILIFSDGTRSDTRGLRKLLAPDADFADRLGALSVMVDRDQVFTNVFQLYQASSPKWQATIDPIHQVAFYDPGLGSAEDVGNEAAGLIPGTRRFYYGSSLYKIWAGLTGYGISNNICQCYEFLLEHYEQGDRIFLFGYSRGAYTVRSLGGVLARVGIDHAGRLATPTHRRHLAYEAVKLYKMRDGKNRERASSRAKGNYSKVTPHAVCVFDTVRALGLGSGLPKPDEVDRKKRPFFYRFCAMVDWLSETWVAPHRFHDDSLNPQVPFAFQAVAVDEIRKPFRVELWDNDPNTHVGVLEQVWFPGDHGDVGGLNKDGHDGRGRDISRLTLSWLLDRLDNFGAGLKVNRKALRLPKEENGRVFHLGPVHDPRDRLVMFGLKLNRLLRCGPREPAQYIGRSSGAGGVRHTGIASGRLEKRLETMVAYRPEALRRNPYFSRYWQGGDGNSLSTVNPVEIGDQIRNG